MALSAESQIPTAKEQGYNVEWTILRGFYMGGKTSDEDYQKWVDAFDAAYASEEFTQIQHDKGLLPSRVDIAIRRSPLGPTSSPQMP